MSLSVIYHPLQSEASDTTSTTLPITSPTSGNPLIACVSWDKSAGTIGADPAGWTLVSQDVTTDVSRAWYRKISDGTETGVTITWSTSEQCEGQVVELTGWAGTPTFHDDASANSGGSSVTGQTTGSVSAVTGERAIAVAMLAVDSAANFQTGLNATNLYLLESGGSHMGAGAGRSGLAVAWREYAPDDAAAATTTWGCADTGDQAAAAVLVYYDDVGDPGSSDYPQISAGVLTTTGAPSGNVVIPAVETGDLILLVAYSSANITGWGESVTSLAANGTGKHSVLGYVVDGTEGWGSGGTLSISLSAPGTWIVRPFVIPAGTWAGNLGTDIAINPTDFSTGATSAAPDPPSLTSGWTGLPTLWLAIVWSSSAGGIITTNPANYETVGSHGAGANGRVSSRELTADTENPGAFALTGSVSWNAWTVAIKGILGSVEIEEDAADAGESSTSSDGLSAQQRPAELGADAATDAAAQTGFQTSAFDVGESTTAAEPALALQKSSEQAGESSTVSIGLRADQRSAAQDGASTSTSAGQAALQNTAAGAGEATTAAAPAVSVQRASAGLSESSTVSEGQDAKQAAATVSGAAAVASEAQHALQRSASTAGSSASVGDATTEAFLAIERDAADVGESSSVGEGQVAVPRDAATGSEAGPASEAHQGLQRSAASASESSSEAQPQVALQTAAAGSGASAALAPAAKLQGRPAAAGGEESTSSASLASKQRRATVTAEAFGRAAAALIAQHAANEQGSSATSSAPLTFKLRSAAEASESADRGVGLIGLPASGTSDANSSSTTSRRAVLLLLGAAIASGCVTTSEGYVRRRIGGVTCSPELAMPVTVEPELQLTATCSPRTN